GGYVDLNESYIDYPTVIKSAGLNGYSKQQATKPTEQAAQKPATKTVTLTIDGETYTGTLVKK
ncbi:MAG: hypothetical protein IKI37_10725, partial [Oscillospiraceae bacterium]|nr:hypothetical protein [Oscillospiraceae bacterium]